MEQLFRNQTSSCVNNDIISHTNQIRSGPRKTATTGNLSGHSSIEKKHNRKKKTENHNKTVGNSYLKKFLKIFPGESLFVEVTTVGGGCCEGVEMLLLLLKLEAA